VTRTGQNPKITPINQVLGENARGASCGDSRPRGGGRFSTLSERSFRNSRSISSRAPAHLICPQRFGIHSRASQRRSRRNHGLGGALKSRAVTPAPPKSGSRQSRRSLLGGGGPLRPPGPRQSDPSGSTRALSGTSFQVGADASGVPFTIPGVRDGKTIPYAPPICLTTL
jgi:hypothetical protein